MKLNNVWTSLIIKLFVLVDWLNTVVFKFNKNIIETLKILNNFVNFIFIFSNLKVKNRILD